jgi:hypothetical protein
MRWTLRALAPVSFMLATAGLMILAFDSVLYDQWAIFVASAGTIVLLVMILFGRFAAGWLGVAACWIYATAIEVIRGPNIIDRIGLCLIFVALALGALAFYTAYRRE